MANLKAITVTSEKSADASAFMVGTDEFAVPLGDLIDISAEIEKQEAQLKHLEGFLAGVMKKLSNERFVANAPEAVVAMERKKQSDSEEKIAALNTPCSCRFSHSSLRVLLNGRTICFPNSRNNIGSTMRR